jgi:peptide deformylase|tara:strand:+ start:447 stop:1037 length:591 start_codon:yes stop_codon:yes gene_type:complete
MKKVINCFKEDNPVIQKKLRKVSIDEGMEIAKELFEILNKRKDGIGLAANQVGIDAAVAVVNVTTPYILINPEIVEAWDEIPFYEGCLSYPGKGVHTKRYESVRIKTEQIEGEWIFSGVDRGESGKGSWEDDEVENDRELRTLEAVCIQHEIDHLNGIRCLDKAVDTTIRVEKKPGRNEPCHCGSGKKFKKCCINK